MHNVTRRRSPALVVALLALFVALTGTAAAAVIITSPDQLGDRVVTQRAIGFGAVSGSQLADGAVHGVHMVHPTLRARVNRDGSHPPFGFDALETKRLKLGVYQVTFSNFDLRGRTLKNCAVTASPRFSITNDQPMVAEVSAGDSLIVTVAISQIAPREAPAWPTTGSTSPRSADAVAVPGGRTARRARSARALVGRVQLALEFVDQVEVQLEQPSHEARHLQDVGAPVR